VGPTDVEKFSDFFHECPIFQIPGRPFPVAIMHSRDIKLATLKTSYVARAMETVLHIHRNEPPGDILVFLTGSREIEEACEELKAIEKELCYPESVKYFHGCEPSCSHSDVDLSDRVIGLEVFGIYSSLETIEQKEIFKPARKGYRKVVFATNIAQVSCSSSSFS
jgi:ATP-dependent RNA helicase DHX8/PRP22